MSAAEHTQAQTLATPPGADTGASFGPGVVGAAMVLLVLAGLALLLGRRRQRSPRRMEVLESLSLSPRRSLCLARVENQLLVLGVSEAGVQLLTTMTNTAAADASFAQLLEQSEAEQALRARLSQVSPGAAS